MGAEGVMETAMEATIRGCVVRFWGWGVGVCR